MQPEGSVPIQQNNLSAVAKPARIVLIPLSLPGLTEQ
jgi:hypothetical protein